MSALARVTGKVTFSKNRRGTSARTGNPYDFDVLTILVAGRGVVECTAPRPEEVGGQVFRTGDDVDLLVSFDVFGANLQTSVVGLYPAELQAAEAERALSAGLVSA